jgi:hypothetical protein
MQDKLFIDMIGWIGGLEVVIAYALISAKKVDGYSLSFQLLNLTGSILLIINTVYHSAYPSAVVNVVWVGIALFSIYKSRSKKN